MRNLSELLRHRREHSGDRRFGLIDDPRTFADAYDDAARLATLFGRQGVRSGDRIAVIGENSQSYLVTWMALQLAGGESALINPTYPDSLLAEMLDDLEPDAVVWVGPEPRPSVRPSVAHFDAGDAADGSLTVNGEHHAATDEPGELPGLAKSPSDVAGYMHTSGTTGTPKFCEQTHEYFLRLGRFIADSMALSEEDTVYAPLPLFHINPLGYGVIGGLLAGADVLSASRFSASRFWPDVRDARVTAMILHAPPVEILKRATRGQDAAGHHVRIVFFADAGFLEEFDIPLGVSAYGSTEVGGLSHVWLWRRGERPELREGMSRYGGRSRHDVTWRVTGDGEIQVRGERPGVLFEGYRRQGVLHRPFDEDGWFPTGDLGRVDEAGNLVFIERRAESIRVKGEFVPIGYVEEHFSKVPSLDDIAIWRRPSELVDDEVALFAVGDAIDVSQLRAAREQLPAFMRPTVLVKVKEIPRDDGVGKIRRRQLAAVEQLETVDLT